MSNTEFRVKKSELKDNNSKEIKSKIFADGAYTSETTSVDKNEKPGHSFTVPLNTYELELLRKVGEQEDRSMRYMSRKLMVKAMNEFLDS